MHEELYTLTLKSDYFFKSQRDLYYAKYVYNTIFSELLGVAYENIIATQERYSTVAIGLIVVYGIKKHY